MQKYRTFLTKKGREKIVAAEAADTHLALRHVAVGDALDPPTEDLTKLRNEVWRGEVNRIQVDAKDAHALNVEAVIPAQDGGFMVRELGLFDTEGDLIAVGRAPDSYKPLVEDGAAKSLLIVFKIVIDNTAVVALSVDDSVVLVTREYLAQQLSLHTTNKTNPHGVTKTQVGLGSVDNVKQATKVEFDAHNANENNPHKVTKAQVGLGSVDNAKQATKVEFDAHTEDKTNPHGVTKAQVGLNNVQNYAVATEAEAKEGTSNTKYMTPLRTNQLVGKIAGETAGGVQTNLNEHIANDRNPHNVTKAQVGLGNVDNVKQATKTEFDIHTEDKTNPHGVTKSQVGLASVLNYGVATQAEAEAGTSNAKYMTPLSTKQAITNTTGTLSNLKTTTKTDLVSAVNEVFTNGNNVKKNTVDALLSVDDKLPITQDSNWDSIINSIGNITTGKKWATGTAEIGNTFVRFEELDFTPSVFIAIHIGNGSNTAGDGRAKGFFAVATQERIYNAPNYYNNGASAYRNYSSTSQSDYFTVSWTDTGSIYLGGPLNAEGMLLRWYIFE